MNWRIGLKALARLWILAAFLLGAGATVLWLQSVQSWQQHLARSEVTGILLFDALKGEAQPPQGVQITAMPQIPVTGARQWARQWVRQQGAGAGVDSSTARGFVTEVSIKLGFAAGGPGQAGAGLRLVIVSPALRYAVADLATAAGQSAAAKLGAVTRLLATHCSDPVVFAQFGEQGWRRINGAEVWGCDAAPRDLRLLAVIVAAVGLAILLSQSGETVARFGTFAQLLRQRRTLGGPDSYSTQGPVELQQIVAAVNDHLAAARAQIAKRATVLSAVSHDLGTPATRLRLRAALIADPTLRQKLEADIDSMTGMIESVLTYTRSELSLEVPRQISLSALVEALVADYQDLGRPVTYVSPVPDVVLGAQSLFSARSGQGGLPDVRRVLVTARPILLQRALANLVDNALKYGRRAEVQLEAIADWAIITVEDEGSELSVAEIEAVLAPFQRGANSTAIDGFGLGLTIVATVATQHGGNLRFERGSQGLRARLEIRRN